MLTNSISQLLKTLGDGFDFTLPFANKALFLSHISKWADHLYGDAPNAPYRDGLPASTDDITYHLRPSVSSSCQLTHSQFYCTVSSDPFLNAVSRSLARYS